MSDYRQEFEARLAKEGNEPWMGLETFPKTVEIIGKLVKDDDYSVKQIYLHALSAYTPEPSNLQSIAQTSEGKTYPIVNTTRVFPQADVLNLGGMSPTAIVHDVSNLVDKNTGEDLTKRMTALYERRDVAELVEDSRERKLALKEIDKQIRVLLRNSVNEVNLENKIILFLDKPKNQTLEMLKPILSHDKYETYYKITDRTQRTGLATKTIKIKGWPAVMVASTKVAASEDTWAEIVSRFDTISPNMNKEKYRAAVQLTAQKKGLPNGALNALLGLDEFKWAAETTSRIIAELKKLREWNQSPGEFTPNIFWIPFYARLGEDLPAEVGRHMRDSTRFFTALQMHSAANVFNRPRVWMDGKPSLIVVRRDYEAAKELYFSGDKAESLLTGLPERVLNWFDVVFTPCWVKVLTAWVDECEEARAEATDEGNRNMKFDDEPLVWVTSRQLTDQTKNAWTQPLTTDAIRKRYLDELIQAGYVDAQDHPTDRRAKHFRLLVDKNTRQNTILHDTEMFSLDSLREALESLRIIKDREHGISLQDFNGEPLTVEQLHEKYYSDLSGSVSFILSDEGTAQEGETGENIATSGKNGYSRVSDEGALIEDLAAFFTDRDQANIQHIHASVTKAGHKLTQDELKAFVKGKPELFEVDGWGTVTIKEAEA